MEKRDGELALALVEIYFKYVMTESTRRRSDLDTVIDAFLYTLKRLQRKDKEMEILESAVIAQEERLKKLVSGGEEIIK